MLFFTLFRAICLKISPNSIAIEPNEITVDALHSQIGIDAVFRWQIAQVWCANL